MTIFFIEISSFFLSFSRKSANHIWQVLLYARRVFYKIDTKLPWNKEAASLYVYNGESFIYMYILCYCGGQFFMDFPHEQIYADILSLIAKVLKSIIIKLLMYLRGKIMGRINHEIHLYYL